MIKIKDVKACVLEAIKYFNTFPADSHRFFR